MTVQFKTADELNIPPPVKGRRRGPIWFVLVALFACAIGTLWLYRNRQGPDTPVPIPRRVPAEQPKDGASDDARELQPSMKPQHPSGRSSPAEGEEKVTETLAPTARRTDTATPELNPRQPSSSGLIPQSAPAMARPISVQMRKEADSFSITLGVPLDERSQVLRTAFLSHAVVDVFVRGSGSDSSLVGRARVTAWREESASDARAVMEFAKTPDLGTLVLLTNARLTPSAKLVIVLETGLKLEYPFAMGSGR